MLCGLLRAVAASVRRLLPRDRQEISDVAGCATGSGCREISNLLSIMPRRPVDPGSVGGLLVRCPVWGGVSRGRVHSWAGIGAGRAALHTLTIAAPPAAPERPAPGPGLGGQAASGADGPAPE
ncbi:hypothetical protein GCM10027614_14310 [Micromonospora vulcania]